MCGIVAVRGRRSGADTVGRLKSLDYRGYDSAGIAVLAPEGGLHTERALGPVDTLAERVERVGGGPAASGLLAIGHTRWATGGAVSIRNTHPLLDCTGTVAVVHNGVLVNAPELRERLQREGHEFASEVDSEVIAHLIEHQLAAGAAPFEAMQQTVATLKGSWAIAALIDGHNAILIARSRSPLMLRGSVGRWVVASDVVATAGIRGPLRVLADGDIAELGTTWRWIGAAGPDRPPATVTVRRRHRPQVDTAADRPPATTTTATEIAEQRDMVSRLVDQVLTRSSSPREWRALGLPRPHRVLLTGCGTSHHAALVTARVLREVAGIDATVCVASEFDPVAAAPFDLAVVLSQSGETVDVLEVLPRLQAPILAVTNAVGSSIARSADAVMDCEAGRERGGAATKTFTSQVLRGIHLALAIAHATGSGPQALTAASRLQRLPVHFAVNLALGPPVTDDELARLATAPGWLFLGTGSALPYAAEGALKLTEITYRWTSCLPAAELRHGPLALVAPGTPAVIVDNGASRLTTTRAELTARGAEVITIDRSPGEIAGQFDADPPWGPLEAIPRLQHLALALGETLGRDIDRPRHLTTAASVP